MNEDKPALSATELLRTENTFQRCIDYVDIAGRSSAICRAFTFALARLSCFIHGMSQIATSSVAFRRQTYTE